MALVMSSIDTDAVSELKCGKCSQVFNKRKYLKRHHESCQSDGESVTENKQKCFSCTQCDSTFRKIKTLNLHIREDHGLDPSEACESSEELPENDPIQDDELVDKTENTETNVKVSTEEAVAPDAEPAEEVSEEATDPVGASEEATGVIEYVDNLSDAVQAYQNEVTPMDDSVVGEAAETVVSDEKVDPEEDEFDLDTEDPRLVKMQNLMKKSEYFRSRKTLFKPYVPSDKTFMTLDDLTLPEGFQVYAQSRPGGRHVDKEFLTPDRYFILRSKVACVEYANLMEILDGQTNDDQKRAAEEENIIEIESPIRVTKKRKSVGPASFKAKLKRKFQETNDDDVIEKLPRGTKIHFQASTPNPGSSFNHGRGVTITPINMSSSMKSSSSSSRRKKSLKCCNRTFMTEVGLNRHKEREHNKPRKTSSESINLIDEEDQQVKCDHCPRIFKSHSKLTGHVKKDHSVKCGDCKDLFPSRLAMLQHTKESHIIPCKKCKTVYRTKEKLSEHEQKIHHNFCKFCDLNFDVRTLLITHIKDNHTFRCIYCSEVSSSEQLLDDHMKEKHHQCEECEDEFSWPDSDHQCFYTQNKQAPQSIRVIEQNLYRGYHFFTAPTISL